MIGCEHTPPLAGRSGKTTDDAANLVARRAAVNLDKIAHHRRSNARLERHDRHWQRLADYLGEGK